MAAGERNLLCGHFFNIMTYHLPLMTYAPWSPSKASLAAQCGKAFKLRYIDKVKGLEQSSVAKIGNVAHRAQELAINGTSTSTAIKTATGEKDNLTHKEREILQSFAGSVDLFLQKLNEFGNKYPIKETRTEMEWAITSDYKPCGYWDSEAMIRGIVDVALLLENGYLIIIDHKSGKKRAISKYAVQLDVYTVMGYAQFPGVKGVQTAINFMAHDADIKWGPPRSPEYIETVLQPWLTKYLTDKVTKLETFGASITPLCGWCDYRDICEEWLAHGEIRKQEA